MSMPYEELVAEYIKCAIKQGKVEELEKIKAEAQKEENIWYHDCEADFSKKYDVIRIDTLFEIIDTRISELKGE